MREHSIQAPDAGGGGAEAPARGTLEAAKLGIWAFLGTEVLLFGGLFTAFVVYRLRYPGMFRADFLLLDRALGAGNTVVLLASSLTAALALASIRAGRTGRLRLFLSLTILLGGVFLGIKGVEWGGKLGHGIRPSTDIFFSLYFMMTGLHALHVLAGMLALGGVLVLAGRGAFSEGYSTPVEISVLYWHFVDLVWIYLFPLFYLIG